MQGMHFTVTVHLHGTLAANARGEFKLPFPASLQAVSISQSAADTDAVLDVGTSADRDGILSAVAAGDNAVPTVYDKDDWDGALATAGDPYHMAKDTIVTWDLDFDGSGGTAAANCMIVFFFTEG